ncbi:MAG: hypothetical protein LBC98_01135, partial [Prevotellaceae bacterium]|nr:hypothetical protein [Prevotellaceae bacterium]
THRIRIPVGLRYKSRRVCGYSQFGFRISIARNQYCTLRTDIYPTQKISALKTPVCICSVCANTPHTNPRLHLLGVCQHTEHEPQLVLDANRDGSVDIVSLDSGFQEP